MRESYPYSYVTTLQMAVDEAIAGNWALVVYPGDSAFGRYYRQAGAALFPPGSSSTGRTTLFPNGGRVTVIPAEAECPVPAGVPFSVIFVGWDEPLLTSKTESMADWRHNAARVLSR